VKVVTEVPYPTSWTFELDQRATHMSLISADDFADLVFATPDSVDEVVSTIVRTRATPADVADILSLAHKLLRTSVVHYEFAALAVEKSLQALERALRLRLGIDRGLTFEKLIDRAADQGLLSGEDEELMDAGRQLRNVFAHPATAPALPLVMVTSMLQTSYRLIGVLFPDPDEFPAHN
jgi:hypothetical protein